MITTTQLPVSDEPCSERVDGRANPVQTSSGNQAVVVEVQRVRAGLHTGSDLTSQAFGAFDFAIEYAKARAKNFFRSQRNSALADDCLALLGRETVNAENGTVADLADFFEIAAT